MNQCGDITNYICTGQERHIDNTHVRILILIINN